MPAPTQFSVQEILNRIYSSATNTLAVTGSGQNRPVSDFTFQNILNAVFSPSTNRIALA